MAERLLELACEVFLLKMTSWLQVWTEKLFWAK